MLKTSFMVDKHDPFVDKKNQEVIGDYERLLELWFKVAPVRKTTLEDYRRAMHGLGRFTGWKAVDQIQRKDILAFRDSLIETGLSTTTVNMRLCMLKSLFRVAMDYEWRPDNPAQQIRVVKSSSPKARIAFSADDLNLLFRSPIYTNNFRPIGGGCEAAYWLPLLALFTGARIEELAQLRVEDVRQAPGLGYFLNISDIDHGQLKNQASRRRIPVHGELIDCGFLDYQATLPATSPLFPDLKRNPRGKLGGYFSNYFSGYLRKKVGITDPRKVFHSFRHTFKDSCRNAGIPEEVHDALSGHTRSGASRRYGNEHYPLAPLFQAMTRFTIEGLDIAHLKPIAIMQKKDKPQARIISSYYGIEISFPAELESPLIVARSGQEALHIHIPDNRIVDGKLSNGKAILVLAWVEIHRSALMINWENAKRSGETFPIAPLH